MTEGAASPTVLAFTPGERGWLKPSLEEAAARVATWPAWKRDLSRVYRG